MGVIWRRRATAAALLLAALALTSCSSASPATTQLPPGLTSSPTADAPSALAPAASPSAPPDAAAVTAAQPSATPSPVATPEDSAPRSPRRPLAQNLAIGVSLPVVKELQARLRQVKLLAIMDLTTNFGEATATGVAKFQAEHGLPATGVVNQTTWDVLLPLTSDPSQGELDNVAAGPWFTGPSHPGYIMELQHRLRQLGLYGGPVDGAFNDATKKAVAAHRTSARLAPAEVMDERAWTKLRAATRQPSYAELFPAAPTGAQAQQLDPRCLQGKVVCISKDQALLSYVVDGQVALTREARFARPGWRSDKGDYRVWYKNNETVSSIFGERTPMPYAIFFDGDVAIHFSDDFADKGTGGGLGSHGCTQLKDYQAMKWLYDHLQVGDRVIVY